MTSVLPAAVASVQKAPISQTHPFTCNTCQVAFRNHDQQRTHYHTDWHQYNLKRKIASLPPLSSETFAEKVLHAKTSSRLEREKATFEKLCQACNKVYYSENAYANHVGSYKHRQNVAMLQTAGLRAGGRGIIGGGPALVDSKGTMDERDETGSVISSTFSLGEPAVVDDDERQKEIKEAKIQAETEFAGMVKDLKISENPKETNQTTSGVSTAEEEDIQEPTELPLEACLFCTYVSPSLQLNISHMTKAHGLFIPERDYLVDLEGLFGYLGQKLLFGNQCLYCNKIKGGLEGIRTHMRDKGHTMLGFESEEQQIELGQFYDFRSSYTDGEDEDEEELATKKRGLKPAKNGDLAEDEGWEGAEDGEGWETDSSASSLDSTEITAVPLDRVWRRTETGRHHMHDGWHSHAHSHGHAQIPNSLAVFHDDYELHLPSGRSVGHRSLARYYRQNLRDSYGQALHNRDVRRIADTRYPRSDDDFSNAEDDEEGGVVVATEERQLNRRERREAERLALVSRGNGGMGMIGVSAAKRREVRAMENKARDFENRGRRRWEWGVNKKGNSQKHYRDPLLQ
ncbi:pre-60S factor rei1 [Rhizina undulata]